MKCPICHAPLSPYSYADQTIDICKACGGVWFDPNELGLVVSALASRDDVPNLHAKEALKFSPPKNPSAEQEKLCPRCNVSTNVFTYSYDSNIFLNSCPSCQGIWADKGELNQLAQYSKGNPAVKALAQELAEYHSHKRSLAYKLLTSRRLSSLVAGIYLIGAIVYGGTEAALRIALFLLLPLACIWFPDAVGNYTGILTFPRPEITKKSPGIILAFVAWLLLLTPLAVSIINAST